MVGYMQHVKKGLAESQIDNMEKDIKDIKRFWGVITCLGIAPIKISEYDVINMNNVYFLGEWDKYLKFYTDKYEQ